jgi:hypothetical protein
MSSSEKTQKIAAAKAGMDVKTARKYLETRRLPSEMRLPVYPRHGVRKAQGGSGNVVTVAGLPSLLLHTIRFFYHIIHLRVAGGASRIPEHEAHFAASTNRIDFSGGSDGRHANRQV